ncbi:MAG TPA: LuxR C-terminal-related transcriptional regulator [Candidatus Thiothrix moscowensis]|uniref:helix-turn-helix transcriptional regulator n=1 Tax=unclassified Thiothrix TaxID=2636184 RepID=UPI0025D1A237|nr:MULTISPECIES: LuxR family transcriptional regulator [unclassified Thiothrix]HRJ51584.1 LuxR C-terminal-related transcriptional regulator [Candidatus Thiothrix moscowensis]HRJ91899.1 LuxR C-terminal-related transcriptional regulator [Candidatus Thiothrix moscowensis]
MHHSKETFFIALLVIVTLLNVYDFYNDYQESEHSRIHLLVEALIILVSVVGISVLMHELWQRQQETENLRKQLSITRADLNETNSKLRQASRQYSEVIQEQLGKWELTPSEQEVALLLLKGLSFEEIAGVRDTKEKTVRQQATAIYRKSGLNGRHEFAAWFFEDFLQ